MATSKLTVERNLADYFRERLQEHGEQLAPPPQEDTLWYMGNMLARFGDSEQLFCYDEGELGIRPLALLYKDAHEAGTTRARCLILRQLGDMALFIGALFPESYARRGILQDYFVGMGGGAYSYLSENAPKNRHIFSELAETFSRMLHLIEQACSKEQLYDASDVLGLYERWRATGDIRLREQLETLGICVMETPLVH